MHRDQYPLMNGYSESVPDLLIETPKKKMELLSVIKNVPDCTKNIQPGQRLF